jgi:hypothetical protein
LQNQPELVFEILGSGLSLSQFLTDPISTLGNPTGNQIRFEVVTKAQSNGNTVGWFNPNSSDFANNDGVEVNGAATQNISGGVRIVCNLRANQPVDQNDIVVARLFVAQGWSNRISTFRITNI